ncbi:hypothetical protein PR202_ga15660 [Eleusine coracana subsp. coracana]|uniref:Nuclear pore complex protein NUP58 n=1 Tax=Eleusine coracana subsp. coracana TaxID=191504 RepID=A0AAV5CL12_ELECO|nr:hypothetical protein PR202_ga15660 [Eleusine coracana subsp. coracana]
MAFSFGSPAPPNPFHTPAPTPAPAPSSSPSPFQFNFQQQPQPQLQQQPQPQQQAAQPQQQQQLMLCTKDGKPAGYNTKWEELHADTQKALLQIEDKIREYRDESERLDQCSRLYDSSISNVNFEQDASRIAQELGGTTTVMEREKASIQDLMTVVNEMMWNTEFAMRSYMMLRPRFTRPGGGVANGGSSNPSAGTPSSQTVTIAPTIDFYSGVPKRPSVFMQQTVNRFECYLAECCKWIDELEQLVRMENNKRSSDSLESLPKVMSNVHDYFIFVASKVENLHQYVESMKSNYLNEQRRMVTPAPSSNLFGASGQAQLSTPFGTSSTPTLITTQSPFASASALGGTSLFSTPFGGGATASGSSFGTSKGRSKARGRR